jgi:hypothetical protein
MEEASVPQQAIIRCKGAIRRIAWFQGLGSLYLLYLWYHQTPVLLHVLVTPQVLGSSSLASKFTTSSMEDGVVAFTAREDAMRFAAMLDAERRHTDEVRAGASACKGQGQSCDSRDG